ncbi:c-type cytochrome [Microvirga arsenatis]|uniref:C-type cytochrome n=1 Tax=Microvirga arsenatis TaxID=2692265 RepID=A0ABW9Z2E7_9HYPH|nr:cytochrome c [Microvirga arsenatis]NBJ13100.1 c-type cytochrome [Microvirga arsenatis]NBJ26851.1 c-type cytochrome [Microvirga arsenatis]
MKRRLTLVGISLALGSSALMAQSGRVQRGFTFAQTNCSQCHAIGRVGESPIPEAPPFRILHTRYPIESLAEAFAEGITTGHPSMPQFQLDPAQINDLLAYLNSIQG